MSLTEPKEKSKGVEKAGNGYKILSRKNVTYLLIVLVPLAVVGGIVALNPQLEAYQDATNYYLLEGLLPKPEPPAMPYGLAKIRLKDSVNNTYFDNVPIELYHYGNESYHTTVLTNVTFLSNSSLTAFVNLTGYHYMAFGVNGSGSSTGDPYVNTYFLKRRAMNTTMSFEIKAIDGNFSKNSVSDITDGFHQITFEITNDGFATNLSLWGEGFYLPNGTYQHKALTVSKNTKGTNSWMYWNGTVTNMEIDGFLSPIYNIGSFNVTTGQLCYCCETFFVSGYFYKISGVGVILGQDWIDDPYDNYVLLEGETL